MAKANSSNGQSASAGDAGGGELNVSSDLLESVQGNLDDAFGGADQDELQREQPADAGDDGDAGDGGVRNAEASRERRRQSRQRQREDLGLEEEREAELEEELVDDTGDDEDSDEASGEAGQAPPTTGDGNQGDTDIPSHLFDAAKRRGRTDESIRRLFEADPEFALETFEQDFKDANELSRQFAEIGRSLGGTQAGAAPQNLGQLPAQGHQQLPGVVGQNQQLPNPSAPPQQQQQQGNAQGLVPAFEFPKEVLEGVDDEFKTGVLERVQTHMNQVNDVLNNVVTQHQSYIQERQVEALNSQVDDFFSSKKEFDGLYGKGRIGDNLEQAAYDARVKVVEQADAIRAGALAQGRRITVSEALEMAHNLVSLPQQQQAARREIRSQLRKRGSQATVRPTNRGGGGDDSSSDPLAKATKTAERKLRKMRT